MSLVRPALLVLLAFGLFAVRSSAQEWTRFRGPNGQGQSDATTIPAEWTDKDYNWKIKLTGKGHSSPVVWGDKIFLLSGDPSNGTHYVICLSTKDGHPLWTREYKSSTHHIHQMNSFASSTPALDKDHVYVSWATPEEITLMALTHDGKDAWSKQLGPFESAHGWGTSPIVYQDMVILTDDQDGQQNFLFALNTKDGSDKWRIPRTRAKDRQNCSYAAPIVYEPKGGAPQLIVDSWGHGMTAIDLKNGKTIWEAKQIFPNRPVACPVIAGGKIWGNCGEGSGNNYVFAVKPGSASGQEPSLELKLDKSVAPYVPCMIAAGKLIYLWTDAGLLSCYNAETAKPVYTRERIGAKFHSSPIRVGDKLYCISQDGDVFVVATGEQYKLISKVALGEGSRATPAVSDGVMYLRTESQLFSLGGKKK